MTLKDGPWAPYRPTDKDPWDAAKVAHLHRRAGFGATWADLTRDLKDGPAASVDRYLRPRTLTADEQGILDSLRPGRPRLGRRRPPQGVVAVPHPLRPRPAAREADAVLARPLRHQQPQGEQHPADARPERAVPQARPRPVRRPAVRRRRRRRHARLARRRRQQEGEAQRELRPRVPGVVHPRRRQLHREGHPRGRPRLHRLVGREGQRRVQRRRPTTAARRPS